MDTGPFVDDRLVHAVVLAGPALAGAGDPLGAGARWARTPPVRRPPILR
ncbi:hypothetical protein AB0F88_30045 [Streptosporangium sp. NPDC023963]